MMFARNFRRFFHKALRQPAYAAKVLAKRLAARFSYAALRGRSTAPESITLFLTHKCNLHCRMCGQWGDGGVTKKAPAGEARAELGYDTVRKLVDEVARSGPSITLFGGEPFLHSRIIDIIRCVKSRRLHCLVITNGSLLGDMAKEVVASGLDELNVSLDAGAELHDEIRGMKGLHDTIMSGLKEIARIKSARRSARPLVNIQCTVSKYNYRHLEQMVGVAQDANADSLTFHNLIFTDRKAIDAQRRYDELLGCSSADWEGFVSEPGIDPAELHARLDAIMSKGRTFAVDFYPNFSAEGLNRYYRDPHYALSGAGPEYPPRCLSPWIAAYVFPDGEVRPCLNSTYSFGNIKGLPFGAVWNGDKAVRFREELRRHRAFPLCARCTELYRY
jgi:MoaA/NifB/PqqE/SkfB family radical SAM enzyme